MSTDKILEMLMRSTMTDKNIGRVEFTMLSQKIDRETRKQTTVLSLKAAGREPFHVEMTFDQARQLAERLSGIRPVEDKVINDLEADATGAGCPKANANKSLRTEAEHDRADMARAEDALKRLEKLFDRLLKAA